MKKISALIYFYCISSLVIAQCSQLFNLYNWEQISNNSNNWIIKDSTEATETKTGGATFLLTPKKMINVEISGQFRNGDYDIMGFAIGLDKSFYDSTNLLKGYLFDWKPLYSHNKGAYKANTGMSLNKIDSLPKKNKYMWGHINDQYFNTLATAGNQSLKLNNWNNFKLIYTSSKLICIINNDTIFNERGCYDAGRFGFYDYSMVNSKFRNFSYKYHADFEVAPTGLCAYNNIVFNSGITSDCSGNIITNALNPDSVFWDFGDGTTSNLFNPSHSFTTNGAKSIKLKLISKNGCVDSITKTIQISQAPIAGFSSSILCEGDTVRFLDTSNTNNISWSWDFDNGSTSQGINNPYTIFNSSGTYDITMAILDSNMCADTITKAIIIKEKISANLGSKIYHCDSIYTINLNLPVGTNVLWSNGSTSSNITFSQSGIYNVSINSNGCNNTDTFNLNLKTKPLAQFNAYDLCVDETLNLSNNSIGSIFSNSWDFGNGSGSTIMNPTTSYSNAGSYDIQLIVSSINNCKDTIIHSLNVTQAPNLELGPDINTCDDIINLSAGINNSTYLWSNGSNSPTTTFNQSGLIWLNVDSGNCSVSDSINYMIYEKPEASFSVEGACSDDTLSLISTSTFNQSPVNQWSWNLNNDIFNANEVHKPFSNAGSVYVKLVVTNSFGCRDSIQKNIAINEPDQSQISTNNDLSILKGEEALLEAYGNGQSYLWSPEGLTYDPYSSSTLSFPLESTTFFVYTYDDQGCLIQDSIRVDIFNNTKIFIPTIFTPNNDGNNDLYYISGDFICDIEYNIYNRWGNLVFKSNNINDKWDGRHKGVEQNNEAYTIVGKAIFCDDTGKSFKGKLHLIR